MIAGKGCSLRPLHGVSVEIVPNRDSATEATRIDNRLQIRQVVRQHDMRDPGSISHVDALFR